MFGSCTRKEIEIEIMANGEIAFYFLYCKLELWQRLAGLQTTKGQATLLNCLG